MPIGHVQMVPLFRRVCPLRVTAAPQIVQSCLPVHDARGALPPLGRPLHIFPGIGCAMPGKMCRVEDVPSHYCSVWVLVGPLLSGKKPANPGEGRAAWWVGQAKNQFCAENRPAISGPLESILFVSCEKLL